MRIALVAVLVGGCFTSVPAPPLPKPRDLGAAWGTAAPYRLVEIDPDGEWAVICQARADTDGDGTILTYWEMHGDTSGDKMTAYLIDRSGRETVIDDVIGRDPSGRWLALTIGKAPLLIDTRTWSRTPIRAELPHFDLGKGMHRWAFDPTGKHLLFFRDGRPVVRTLATGAETEIAPAAWSARWSTDGAWVQLEELAGDTNHDGFVHGPNNMPVESGSWVNCGTHFDWGSGIQDLGIDFEHYVTAEGAERTRLDNAIENSDDLRERLWRVSDGKLVVATTPIDRDRVVVRGTDSALEIQAVDTGKRVSLAAADCHAEILETYRGSLLYTCRVDDTTVSLHWYRDGSRSTLADKTDRTELSTYSNGRVARLTYRAASQHAVIDMGTGKILATGSVYPLWDDDDRVVIAKITKTLEPKYVEHATLELRWFDGRTKHLPSSDDAYPPLSSGRFLSYGTFRVDLETGDATRIAKRPIAIRTDGAILLDGGEPTSLPPDLADLLEDHRALHHGPLRWTR